MSDFDWQKATRDERRTVVLGLIQDGLSNTQIGERCGVNRNIIAGFVFRHIDNKATRKAAKKPVQARPRRTVVTPRSTKRRQTWQPRVIVPAEIVETAETPTTTFRDLEAGMCRHPFFQTARDTPDPLDLPYCGRKTGGKTYCPYHAQTRKQPLLNKTG